MKIKFTHITLILSLFGTVALSEQPTNFGKAVKIVKTSEAKLTSDQRSSFRRFKKRKNYFGAFAIDVSGNYSYWFTGFSSLGLAKKAALKGCETTAKLDGGTADCVLYALTLPKNLPATTTDAVGFSRPAAKIFLGDYQKKQTTGHFGAFAMTLGYNYGYSYSWTNIAEAKATAIAYCEAGVANALARFNIETRAWAKRQGLTKCRIVSTVKGE